MRIVGRETLPAMAAFDDVAMAMRFDEEIILGAHAAPWVGESVPDGAAIYNMEPLYDGCRSFSIGYLDTLKRCRVVDYSASNVQYLAAHGVDAFHMPYGWHRGLEAKEQVGEKDIDVLLIGSVNPRRRAIVNRLLEQFNVVWASGVYGLERDRLASRAKVHLNVHYTRDHPLEVARLNYLLANGWNVVSEPGNDEGVNQAYAHGARLSWDLGSAISEAMTSPMDGADFIRSLPHDCAAANEWLLSRKGN